MNNRIVSVRLAVVAVLTATTALATPAHAATRPRPVTITVVDSTCVNYSWVLTIRVTSTTDRTVDLRYTSDYGDHPTFATPGDVEMLGVHLRAGVPLDVASVPGASAQYAEEYVARPGTTQDTADPLAQAPAVYPPHVLDPRRVC